MNQNRQSDASRPVRVAERRYARTLNFLSGSANPPATILDLGTDNELAGHMRAAGYSVRNTSGDLDLTPDVVRGGGEDAVTAFEILEHLVSPFGVLRVIEAKRLFATVPLRLWFAAAYRNPSDPWDRHFHEFERWQFEWLLEKSGWSVIRSEVWTSPIASLGVRPLLRLFAPRYYAVEAVRPDPDPPASASVP